MTTIQTLDSITLSSVTGGQVDSVVDDCISKGISDGFAKQKEYKGATRAQLQKVFSAYQQASTHACEALKAQGIKRPGVF